MITGKYTTKPPKVLTEEEFFDMAYKDFKKHKPVLTEKLLMDWRNCFFHMIRNSSRSFDWDTLDALFFNWDMSNYEYCDVVTWELFLQEFEYVADRHKDCLDRAFRCHKIFRNLFKEEFETKYASHTGKSLVTSLYWAIDHYQFDNKCSTRKIESLSLKNGERAIRALLSEDRILYPKITVGNLSWIWKHEEGLETERGVVVFQWKPKYRNYAVEMTVLKDRLLFLRSNKKEDDGYFWLEMVMLSETDEEIENVFLNLYNMKDDEGLETSEDGNSDAS